MQFNKYSINWQVLIRLVLIFSIGIAAIAKCTAQEVEQIGTYPVSTTDPASLQNRPTFPAYPHEVDPVSRRMTFRYEPIKERSTWSFKKSLVRCVVPTVWSAGTGAIGAINQVDLFKTDAFLDAHPKLNRAYWDRSISYQNKRFLGASRDGYHDTQKLHAWGMGLIGGAITLPIVHNYQQQKKWQTVVDLGLMLLCSFTSYQIVSQAVYNAY